MEILQVEESSKANIDEPAATCSLTVTIGGIKHELDIESWFTFTESDIDQGNNLTPPSSTISDPHVYIRGVHLYHEGNEVNHEDAGIHEDKLIELAEKYCLD